MPRTVHVRRVGAEAEDAPLAQLGELRVVRGLSINGARVQLEVPRVDDGPHGRLDGQADPVGDGMSHADGLDAERPQLDHVARLDGAKIGLLREAVLAEPVLHQRQRERRAVDRCVDLPQQVRQGADVVLVAVGEHHPPEGRPLGQKVGEVRDDPVDAQHLVVREHDAAVESDQVVPGLHQHHVEPDLAEAAQGDQADGGLGGGGDEGGIDADVHAGQTPIIRTFSSYHPGSRGRRNLGVKTLQGRGFPPGAPDRCRQPRATAAPSPRSRRARRPGRWPEFFYAG